MNTGIGDAINLAWKLKAVLKSGAPDMLLDSYETERIAFARRLVKSTDRVFTLATAEGMVADIVRTRVVPTVFPTLAKLELFREFLFRTVSQITINYRHCPLSDGRAGGVYGGDRLPWVVVSSTDNYEPLNAMSWQVHVYGAATPELRVWCDSRSLPLHVFPWRQEYGNAGFAQDATYLIRPDTYVALADDSSAVNSCIDTSIILKYLQTTPPRGTRLDQMADLQRRAGSGRDRSHSQSWGGLCGLADGAGCESSSCFDFVNLAGPARSHDANSSSNAFTFDSPIRFIGC